LAQADRALGLAAPPTAGIVLLQEDPVRIWLLGALLAGSVGLVATAHAERPPPMEQRAMAQLDLTRLDGTPLDAKALDGKVVLFVNVASKCGFTPQYEGLQLLHEEKSPDGLVIVGVPCNQFGGQEPGDAEQIASFCRINYGVNFPILEKQDVNGAARSDLYTWLVGSDVGRGKDVRWNFEKFLVDRNGMVVERFGSRVDPNDGKLRRAIEQALTKR